MKRAFVLSVVLACAGIAEPPAPVEGKVVPKPGEKPVIFLSFRDQAAADEGRPTKPVQVEVKDGSFLFPGSLPIGVTIGTTPPCVDLEAILVQPKAGAPPLNLLDQFRPVKSAVPAPEAPVLGNATQTKIDDFDFLSGLFHSTSKTILSADKITTGSGSVGYSKLGAQGDVTKLIGGVNLGCRNEKKAQGGTK